MNLTNTTITGNTADEGGGIYAHSAGGDTVVNMTNAIVWGNDWTALGDDIYMSQIAYYETTFNVSHSDVGNVYNHLFCTYNNLGGNLNTDPRFEYPEHRDYHLQKGSPAIDAGTCGSWYVNGYRRTTPFSGDKRWYLREMGDWNLPPDRSRC